MEYIYKKITDMIIKKLEENIIPWQKTWKTDYPKNLVSGNEYRGINIMLLGLQDYEYPYWLTFKQCKDLGGSVIKGEHSSLVVFWKPVVSINQNHNSGNHDIDDPSVDIHFLLRYYYVFNITQCNIPDEVLKKKNIMATNPKIIEAEEVLRKYKNPPKITIDNLLPNPRYLPRLDRIDIPAISCFNTSDDYYSALYHEILHSTGNRERLARKGIIDPIQFGSDNYSKEELIAEIGSAYLCNISGIQKTIDNQSSYISSWLKALNNDNRMILIAASQAQRACDYILNNSSTNTKEDL